MTLNAPTKVVFLLSLVIAIIGVVAAFNLLTFVPIPAFWIMTLAYLLMVGGSLLKVV
ncbi:hypothetical protein JYP49_06865 [Nitratireductor aquimarinus]|uniref:hypothetical protein n=1 Tax=Nitratireductor TaxID=245876 RepID=UPI0019D37D4D|nr:MULTISPECIES: hypothetical protein [Nitratireductor]MBN7776970.1 hypothetical protein [Nitratireductor pacificus]MBN7780304.1 hypothetical protein [Nitratireductor pacificus]MBN7789111.1 hypothetical protein [Nitratireductor aquimarinus]MBY6099179.1 hypothetical protein [Nitratireductor aquimarinus]MCA1261526.1 hypothetical protein [Nitratireductor aquimarinus]